MALELKVPVLPESVSDATIATWHKKPGDAVKRDENLADLETDKVVLEVPAPAGGILRELKVESGTTVKSGQILAVLEEGAAAQAATAAKPGNDGKLSPSARRLIEENSLDPATIPASGRDGLVTKGDVVEFLDKRKEPKPAAAQPAALAAPRAPAPQSAPASAPKLAPAPGSESVAESDVVARPAAASARGERRVPMTRLRQRIAQRLVEAQSSQALLTSFNEVDLTAVQELRARYKDRFEKEQGVKLGLMSFFVKAAIAGLQKFPVVNASVDGTDILFHDYYDIGVAVSTDRGLVVPIVRDADQKGFGQIEKEVAAYAGQARSASLAIEDLTGGTFTITNGGVFGSLMSTPIVNAPQSAILGMHKIQERPMAVTGQVLIRPMMYIAVTYDHRIIDGREAVQFLVTIKDCLEDPGRMLLGI